MGCWAVSMTETQQGFGRSRSFRRRHLASGPKLDFGPMGVRRTRPSRITGPCSSCDGTLSAAEVAAAYRAATRAEGVEAVWPPRNARSLAESRDSAHGEGRHRGPDSGAGRLAGSQNSCDRFPPGVRTRAPVVKDRCGEWRWTLGCSGTRTPRAQPCASSASLAVGIGHLYLLCAS